MFTTPELAALALTLKLASVSTGILLLLGMPLAWWLARSRARYKALVEALVAAPLVLPPTVLGFYLLILFAPQAPLGSLWQSITGSQLAFSFAGLVAGSVIYSLPFVVQPIQSSFEKIPELTLNTASALGASDWDRYLNVVIPMCKRSIIAAAALGFAHVLGEFGIVLMIGGNIPGETQVLSIALFEHVEALDYGSAHRIALGLLAFSLLILILLYALGRGSRVPVIYAKR